MGARTGKALVTEDDAVANPASAFQDLSHLNQSFIGL